MSHPTDPLISQLSRGVEHIYSIDELRSKLSTGRKLRIKLGMDPTAPDLHLGHTVVLRKLRQFQDAGHQAILIIGDYTAKIGDPTGRDTTRPILDDTTIAKNAQTYLDQASKILDTSPDKLLVQHNSQWLSKLSFADVLKLTGHITVQQMLHRENFAQRIQAGREIMVSEFMYPLMQAYDSVIINADVELGGTDQTFNNLVGRDLMAKHNLEKQVVIVMPILVGLDGKDKMSKSKANYVGVTFTPDDMYGKIMSIPDQLMPNYFQLLTNLPQDRIASLLNPEITHPRQAKDILAKTIVEEFHNASAANHASEEFKKRFSQGQLPSDIPTHKTSQSPIPILTLLRETGFASSNAEARRLIEQASVTFNNQKITDPKATVEIKDSPILQVGKRRICQLTL